MANWRELEARVDRTTARLFGERVRLAFLKNGVVDPDRAAVDINAILHCGGDHSAALGTGFVTWLSAGKAELVIDRSSYVGPMPKKSDKVRAYERGASVWFEVLTVSDRYSNLLVLSLGEA
ncbi:hypothetical protein HUU61_21560 [Rhodopseudomonas palustris]|nr:hypothetical protein [Rhodopseudomonas palustris]